MLARAKTFGGHATIGVYWDYSSIPQKPFQSADEQSRFSNAMHEMPKWFAHPHTIVLMMSQPLPPRTDQQLVDEMEYENTRDYYERGYPYFERSVAASSRILLAYGTTPNGQSTLQMARAEVKLGRKHRHSVISRQRCVSSGRRH